MNIFRSFIKRLPSGELDARGVTSVECYRAWLESRKSVSSSPEKTFQRALSGHVTGADGRVPFEAEEEAAILKALRRKARWECFKHCDVKFGESGFRSKGFHEKAISGEIYKTQPPKKRAKRAWEKLKKISSQAAPVETDLESSSSEGEDEDDSDEDAEQTEEQKDEHAVEEDFWHNQSQRKRPFSHLSRPAVPESVSEVYPTKLHQSASIALRMPIPSFFSSASGAAASLLSMVASMILSIAASGSAWLVCLQTLTKAVLLSRGWFWSPTMQQAEDLMRRLNAQYPDDYIILHDYTARIAEDRIILQNQASIRLFGHIARQYGGFTAVRVPVFEVWSIIKAYADAAMAPPGQETRSQVWLYAKGQLKYLEVFVRCDDASHLFIERGRVIENAVLPPNLAAQLPEGTFVNMNRS